MEAACAQYSNRLRSSHSSASRSVRSNAPRRLHSTSRWVRAAALGLDLTVALANAQGVRLGQRATRLQLLPHLGGVVDAEDHDVARPAAVQGPAGGLHLIEHDLHAPDTGAGTDRLLDALQ